MCCFPLKFGKCFKNVKNAHVKIFAPPNIHFFEHSGLFLLLLSSGVIELAIILEGPYFRNWATAPLAFCLG